ncbi:MAG: SWIM zinc finger family protein [Opitutales bacterium]
MAKEVSSFLWFDYVLTTDQVTAVVPDAASFKAGKALAVDRKWDMLGGDADIIWGLAKGSGKNPYQTQVTLGQMAYKCSCPSRKFPCKHAIGLMFLAAENPALLTEKERPDWVSEWLKTREANEKKAETRAANRATDKPKDEKAVAQRQAKKTARIEEGVRQLQQVLLDLASNGIGREEICQQRYWDELARRMVDAQAPGLAGYLRRLGDLPNSQLDWESRLLHELGNLYLLAGNYTRIEDHPEPMREELRQLVGLTTDKDTILAQSGVSDRWFVAARRQSQQDRLTTSATWLYGRETFRWGLKLEFAVPPSRPREHWSLGATVKTELVYYPGLAPDRILPRSDSVSAQQETLPKPSDSGLSAMLERYAKQLEQNPWRARMPFLIQLHPAIKDAQLYLVDEQSNGIPCEASKDVQLLIASLSGGHPTLVCAEWNGYQAQPLAIADGASWVSLQEIAS